MPTSATLTILIQQPRFVTMLGLTPARVALFACILSGCGEEFPAALPLDAPSLGAVDQGSTRAVDAATEAGSTPSLDAAPPLDARPIEDAAPADAALGDAWIEPDIRHGPDAAPQRDAWIDPCPTPEIQARGAPLEPQEGVILMDCTVHEWRFVAVAGRPISIRVRPWSDLSEAQISITWPDVGGLAPALSGATVDALEHPPLTFTPTVSGEQRVLIRGAPGRSGRYDLRVEREGEAPRISRYPILLVHGWTGWRELAAYTYFYGVQDHLEARGFHVAAAELDPYNSTIIRADQLAVQVDALLAETHAARINIIAHSQGGLDSRRIISALGYADRVATLTTISTPHRGTPLLDVGLGLLPGAAETVLATLLDMLGAAAVDSESNAQASFEAMTESYVQGEFNPSHPDDPRVDYRSYAGKTCTLGISCGDICDIEIQWSYTLIQAIEGDNDGIVPVSSAVWGDYRGEIPADHFDEVGQLAGITGPNFDHLEFYLGLAEDLAREGY